MLLYRRSAAVCAVHYHDSVNARWAPLAPHQQYHGLDTQVAFAESLFLVGRVMDTGGDGSA